MQEVPLFVDVFLSESRYDTVLRGRDTTVVASTASVLPAPFGYHVHWPITPVIETLARCRHEPSRFFIKLGVWFCKVRKRSLLIYIYVHIRVCQHTAIPSDTLLRISCDLVPRSHEPFYISRCSRRFQIDLFSSLGLRLLVFK